MKGYRFDGFASVVLQVVQERAVFQKDDIAFDIQRRLWLFLLSVFVFFIIFFNGFFDDTCCII